MFLLNLRVRQALWVSWGGDTLKCSCSFYRVTLGLHRVLALPPGASVYTFVPFPCILRCLFLSDDTEHESGSISVVTSIPTLFQLASQGKFP